MGRSRTFAVRSGQRGVEARDRAADTGLGCSFVAHQVRGLQSPQVLNKLVVRVVLHVVHAVCQRATVECVPLRPDLLPELREQPRA